MKILFTLIMLISIAGCNKVKLPDATLDHEIICGKDPCKPGNGLSGTLLIFEKDPVSPDVTASTNAKEVALQLVGKTVKRGDFTGRDPITCHATESTPFGESEIDLKSGSWKKVDYKRKEELSIDINAAVEADLDAIKKIAPQLDLAQIEAKINAAYSSVNGTELIVNAYYSEYGLKSTAIDDITRGVKFSDCKQFLEKYDRALITDIGLLYFDITKNGESIEDIGAALESELEQQGIKYNLSASIRRKVTENINSTVDAGYQVVTWRIYFVDPDLTL